MPKDIRSYFSIISPKSTKPDVEKNKKDKKKKMVIISDSESDDEEHNKTKMESKSKSPKSEKNKSKSPTKQNGTGSGKKKEKEVKSHYFESLKPVNPTDVFGSAPVKRTGVPVIKNKTPKNAVKKKKHLVVADDDDDFDAALMQLDDNNVQLLMENKYKEDKTDIMENNSKMEVDIGSVKEKIESFKDKTPVPNGEVIKNKKQKKTKKNKKRSPKKESSRNKNTDSAAVCLVLSESSDSENDESNSKSNVKDKSCSPKSNNQGKKGPGSKKIPQTVLTDFLSDSDSDEESVKSNSKTKSFQKRKFEISDGPSSSSPKKQKLMNMDVSGQKRKTDTPVIANEFTPEKKQKKQSSSEISTNKSTKSSNFINSVPKEPIISNLWVDKYKPTNLKQLIGQQGDKSNVKKLVSWLQNWRKNHNGKTKLSRPSPWAKNDDGSYFKAALLSGPPGIGKTTTAHLVCKELGYDVVEFNASDTRSKKLLQQEVSELLSTTSLAPYFKNLNLNTGGGGEQEVTTNHVLLMDEVDGMAGNEDRGGIQELIQLIKMSRVPVICMCNDRNHPKMRSLVNYCYDLRFSRPRIEQIKGAMMTICFKEGLKISSDQLNDIIRSTNQDIRLVLNHLSVLAAQKDNNLPNSEKFVRLGPWDVLRKVFSEEELKKMSFNEKTDLFFHDYSIAPLFVQENYLSVVPHGKFNKMETMKIFAKAAESISTADIVEKRIRSTNTWSLLPVEAVFASVVPGETLKGHMGGQINFPAWLGKNSTKNKMDRLLQELLVHTRLRVSGSKDALNLDYSSHLRQLIVGPLVQDGSDGVQDALNALQNYDLLKEDLENLSELCKWPNMKDPMDKVESKVKAAFTRAYNKSSNLSPYAVSAVIKKGRGGNTAMDTDELYGESNEDDPVLEEENEEDDSIEVDAMIVAKKKTSKKQQEPSTSKQKGSGGGKRGGRGSKK